MAAGHAVQSVVATLLRASKGLARIEAWAAACCALLVTLLILFNVFTRAANNAVFWVDEAAIYAMVWMTFLVASVSLARRDAVAVTLLTDILPRRAREAVMLFVDVTVLVFALMLLILSWRWFDPLRFGGHGFDSAAFSMESMNFIYQERTSTLPLLKWWVWLIIPLFALGSTLHAVANLGQRITASDDDPDEDGK